MYFYKMEKKHTQNIKVTDKTKEQLMDANWEELSVDEQILKSELKRNPDISLDVAIGLLELLP